MSTRITGSGTSAVSIVPAPSVDSIVSRPPRSAIALTHADESDAAVAHVVRVEAPAVVLDDEGHAVRRTGSGASRTVCASACFWTFVNASCAIR